MNSNEISMRDVCDYNSNCQGIDDKEEKIIMALEKYEVIFPHQFKWLSKFTNEKPNLKQIKIIKKWFEGKRVLKYTILLKLPNGDIFKLEQKSYTNRNDTDTIANKIMPHTLNKIMSRFKNE
jgi:hypothetical protein